MNQDSPNEVRDDSPYVQLDVSREDHDTSMLSEDMVESDKDERDREDNEGHEHNEEGSCDEGEELLHEQQEEEKRSLRPSNNDKRGVFAEHGDESDPEIDSDAEDFHQPCLANCLTALKQYFFNRLEQVVLFKGGSPDHLKGWKIQVVKRTGGLTLGLIEVFYFSHRGKKFRSRVEVACFLNLMPSIKNMRSMTREQFYINAIETRERHLISQQLAICNFSCEEILFHDDVITLVSNGMETSTNLSANSSQQEDPAIPAEQKPAFIDFRTAKDLYFSFGNMIVLDWGKLQTDPLFHSNNQLFPLGFRCLRQEHDVVLDRVVDCLCEIDAVVEGGDGSSVLQMIRRSGGQIELPRPLQPLFRLSVAWHVGDEKNIGTATEQDSVQVRVYEARTPQAAWQSAMLEGMGLKDDKLARPGSVTTTQEDPVGADAITAEGEAEDQTDSASLEEPDEEELALRIKIREQRRAYFRVLRTEQSAGMQAAVRPRLSLEAIDSFAEDLVLRLFEGMESSLNCRNYQYMDSREREAGKKQMLKGYSKAFTKAKNLDRVIRKNVYLAEQIQQLEQKRRRVEDIESRKRAKTEDKEMRSLLITAQKSRTAKMRELEKSVTLLKVAMGKTVKKRRDDAKLLAEILCDKEELQRFSKANGLSTSPSTHVKSLRRESLEVDKHHTASTESRPEGLENSVVLDGSVVGQLVEVWEFLNTFGKDMQVSAEDIPSIETLMQAVKVCNPAYRNIKDYTRGLERSFDRAVQYQGADLTDRQANAVLNKLGVVFCQSLLREFDRIMGIDLAEMQLGGLRIPLNELTWREIARVVLLGSCCREVGVADMDIAGLLKGRGFYTTPESADRKVLKLARRRIKFAYVIRSELQESVFGFGSGLCVRLPAPANPYIEGTVFWTELIASLKQVPDSSGWLIYEIIKAAALAVCILDTTAAAKKLKRSLLRTLSLPSFRMNNGAETKAAALQILLEEEQLSSQLRLTNGRWRKSLPSSSSVAASDAMEVSSNSSSGSALQAVDALCDKLRLVYDQSPYMVPPSTFDLWVKQLREAARHADLRKSSVPTFTAASLEEADRQEAAERDLANAMEEDVVEGENSEVQVVKSETTAEVPEFEVIDDDSTQAEKLSCAMQRCYLVLRDLMAHPQANPFNWPVDFGALPGYYKSIAQPLSLSEVRKFLVEGRYEDSIFKFYSDVLLVIENAMAYNQENSAVKLSAQKILTVFERLFFETVLCWDNPLPFHDSCHACRSPYPISVSKAAVCDRCEGTYHLHCLDPPMHTPPRSEWYCLPCVEQKGVPTAHPYKTADVLHPTDPEARGEVVGMEQIRQTAMFVVEFGSVRELWDGKKVRQYAIEPQNEEALLPKGTFVLKDDPESLKGTLGHSGSSETDVTVASADKTVSSVYTMPSGYSYEDYDRVCGIARAYTGWGASHYLVPPVIMDEHSLLAQNRSKHDTMFPQFRESVAVLGPAAGGVLGDALSSKEWGTVLSALLHRVMDIASLNTTLNQMDDAVDDDLIAQIQDGVHSSSLPLDKVFALVRGEGLIKTVKVVDPDAPVEPPRRGRKKRVVEGTSAVPVKPVAASASSAAGDEEDGADEEDDGEDEWDDDLDESAAPTQSSKKDEKKPSTKKMGSASKARKVILDDEEEEMDFGESSTPAFNKRASSAEESDEDELEFFDEHGNCLTSGSGPGAPAQSPPQRSQSAVSASADYVMGGDAEPLCSAAGDSPSAQVTEDAVKSLEPETEEEWNLRHISRQKGREDALLTQTLVLDTITQLDVDGSKEKDEEVFKLINQDDIGGDFYSVAVNAIVKSCLGRPSESLVALEWTRGWEAKMDAMQHYLHEYTFQDKELLCPICGFEEGYLSSPFVWGQSTEEWEADVLADTAQDVLTEPEPPNEINAFPLAAGVSASTGIKGFRARYRVMKGLVWRPYDQTEAQVEEAECCSAKRTLKAGTLVMHECCANFMHFNRQMKQDKSRKMEDQRIVEVICGIGRAKCTPIGIDREGSFYWILRGCKALFVSTGGVETLREKSAQKNSAPAASRWSMYRNEAEISVVLNWLDPKLTNERILKKTIGILFPNAVTDVEEGDTKPAVVVTNAEVKVEEVQNAAAVTEETTAMQVEEEATEAVTAAIPAVVPVVPAVMAPIKLNRQMSVDLMEQSGDEGESDDEEFKEDLKKSETADEESEAQLEEADDADDAELTNVTSLRRNAVRGGAAGSSQGGASHSVEGDATDSADAPPLTARELVLRDQRRATALDALNNRPALTNRNPLLDIYNPEPDFTGSKKASAFKFRKGDHVLVDASTRNHILWDARVLECKTYKVVCAGAGAAADEEFTEQLLYYKVRFDRWGSAYDGWYEECQLLSANATVSAVGRPKTSARALAQESKVDFIRQNVWTPPEILQTLSAYNFINEPQRACGGRPRLTYSDCESSIGLLRSAMLMIEAALPIGAVDESDDRWAEDFAVPWREAVAVASDAISLMQCQLMLEYGIRTSWLRPTGLKMFSCLPSRVQCARNATVGLVAIRVWVLDATIKYDQVKKEDKPSGNGKGRPPKSASNHSSSKGNISSSSNKKARK